ncbi:uracil-DNA glycosylase family protein [Dokdonia ponticola]|uniref:Uracil-DNA glycosylase family protein n=1 Tax=Dokdonia ponticola TaxID=2041041 RepID=A0ABV9HXS9_9FLAO
MKNLVTSIQSCTVCKAHLPVTPNPIFRIHPKARVVIISQAPGSIAHQSSVPWKDPGGRQLRLWLDCDEETFYDPTKVAIVPMGFCYPGKGKTGDLPPRPECAPLWHEVVLNSMPETKLVILIGNYSQKYYLKKTRKKNLTETVRHFQEYLPEVFPLPHPSPRNRFWLTKNPWFDTDVLPRVQSAFAKAVSD